MSYGVASYQYRGDDGEICILCIKLKLPLRRRRQPCYLITTWIAMPGSCRTPSLRLVEYDPQGPSTGFVGLRAVRPKHAARWLPTRSWALTKCIKLGW